MPGMPLPINFKKTMLKILNHETVRIVPSYFACAAGFGCGAETGPAFEAGPEGGGYDGFGVRWLAPASGNGTPLPAPNEYVLKDITEWREKVHFPDVSAFDWKSKSEADLKTVNRKKQLVDYGVGYGVFMRMTHLMGFEEALMAMITDPEEVSALLDRITDYKIEMLEKVVEYYHPDTVTYGDDIATQRSLFMSPDLYREFIKPQHIRFTKACESHGIIPIYHLCGLGESIIEDIIESGWKAWTVIQPINNIERLIEQYGDKITFIGGYNTNGRPGFSDATSEEINDEIHRCFDQYGKYHKAYVFFGFRNVNSLDPQKIMETMVPLVKESIIYSLKTPFKR